MKQDHQNNIKCTNIGTFGSYVFILTTEINNKKRCLAFESFEDGSGFKPLGNKWFTLDEAEKIVEALKQKPNLKLLIKRFKREHKKFIALHPELS